MSTYGGGRMTVERKYALTKVKRGDYLLPSNDARTVWRIAVYTDGPSAGLDTATDRDYWGVWRWAGESPDFVDTEDWARWEFAEGLHRSRSEAVSRAMEI